MAKMMIIYTYRYLDYLLIPCTDKKTNRLIIKQINLGFLLKSQMTRLKSSHLGHFVQIPSSLEKIIMLRNIEGKRRKAQPAAK